MKKLRLLSIAFGMVAALSLATVLSAEEAATDAAKVEAAAPGEKAGGCMPDGGCCGGSGACAQAGEAAPKEGAAEAAKMDCPCKRNRAKQKAE